MATAAMACGVGVINQEVRLLAALVKNRVLRYSTLGERARLLTENKAGSNPATSAKPWRCKKPNKGHFGGRP